MLNKIWNQIDQLRDYVHDHAPGLQQRGWLPKCCDGLVWRLELSGITDLTAEAIWNHNSGSGRFITEVVSDKRERRLRQALADHQRWRKRQEPQFGKWVVDWQCFTDIIIILPEATWIEDLRNNTGERIQLMVQHLKWYHARSFQKSLPSRRLPTIAKPIDPSTEEPPQEVHPLSKMSEEWEKRLPLLRYLVRPDPNLAKDRIRFLFGTGVYLPDPDASPAFHILPALDHRPIGPPMIKLWQDGLLLERQAGFYADQECLLFTPEGQGPLPITGWHAPDGTYLLIRRVGENDWQAYSDNNAKVSRRKKKGGVWLFERHPTSDTNEQTDTDKQVLSIEIAAEITGAIDGSAGATVISGLANQTSPYTLELEAIGLPKLASEITKWTIWFNSDASLATNEQITTQRDELTSLCLDKDGLQLSLPEVDHPIHLGHKISEPLELNDGNIKLIPIKVPGLLGIVQFLHATSYNLNQQPYVIGRTDIAKPEEVQPDIPLDQLAQQGGVSWKNSVNRDWTMANLGLSRQHAKVWIEDDRLVVEPIKGSFRVLDCNCRLKNNLHSGRETQLRLDPGDILLIDKYLLRYNAEALD